MNQKIIKSENFDTTDSLLSDKSKPAPIRSGYFITREGRKFLTSLGYEAQDERRQFAAGLLHDFASTLKEIVKAEMLEEMRKRIDNLETMYR